MSNDFFDISSRELLDTITSGVAVYSVINEGTSGKDYIVDYFNKTSLEIEGKTKEEVIGKSLHDLRPNIDEFGLIPVFREVWKTGEPSYYPAKVYIDETFANWYENRVFRLPNKQIVAVYNDVTEQKVVEESLKRNEALLREIINSMEKAIAVYRPVDGGKDFAFVDMNEFGEKITHYKIKDVVGKRITELFPGEPTVGLLAKLRETWETGKTTSIPLKQYQDDRITQWVENTIFKLPSGNVVAMFEDTYEKKTAELALKESEEKLRSYIDNAPDGFFIANEKGEYLEVNSTACDMTGYTREELLQKNIPELIPPDAQQIAVEHFQQVILTGLADGNIPFLRKDGKRRIWHIKAVRLTEGRYMAFTRDITELRETQELLKKNESRYQLSQQIGKVGNWEYNVNTKALWVSDETKRIYGFPVEKENLILEDFQECIPDRDLLRVALKNLIEKEEPYRLEFDIFPADSSPRKTITSIAELQKNANGESIAVTGIIQDVTERKEAELALRTSEYKYRSLFNSIQDAILLVDIDRNIVDCNRILLNLFGYSREEVVGKKTIILYENVGVFKNIGKKLADNFGSRTVVTVTLDYKKKDGTVFPGETNIFYKLDDHGEPVGFIGLIRDISDRKLLEEQIRQSQKMEAIGQLAGGIAHDFNNLLTIINGYSDLLIHSKKKTDEDYEALQQIRQAGQRASALTGQLLAFSRKQVLKPETVDVNELIEQVEKMLQRLIGEHIDLITDLEIPLASVKVDRGQFEQIVLNLAVNARDAMPKGGKLIIRTQNLYMDPESARRNGITLTGHLVLLQITDNGVGMSPEVQQRIFEPFFTTKKLGKGTGMGLPTVYGIVKQSEGDIRVFSQPDEGTIFKIYFPALNVPSPREEDSSDGQLYVLGHETILVVEDEEPVRKLIKWALSQHGYNLLLAANGAEALQEFKSHAGKIDLLLTDVIMPGMSGRDVADAIVKEDPDIKVCFMSGYTDEAIAPLGVLDQEVHFIPKPFSPSKLLKKIRSVLSGTCSDDEIKLP